MASIEITRSGSDFVARASSYLGEKFSSFNLACKIHGFRWNGKRSYESRNIGGLGGLPAFMLDLFVAGIDVDLDSETEKALVESSKSVSAGCDHADDLVASLGLKGEPYGFQREGILFLRENDHALLGDDMGLGKTIQVLLALDARKTMPGANVMVPASIVLKWARETRTWRPDLDCAIVMKSATKRLRGELGLRGIEVIDSMRWARAGEVVICNYESMGSSYEISQGTRGQVIYRKSDQERTGSKVLIEQTMHGKPLDGCVLVGDEIHRCKNPKAKVTRKWRGLIKDASRTWGLSGTPLFNRPPDLWNVLLDLDLNRVVFSGWKDFVSRMGGEYESVWAGKSRGMIQTLKWSGRVDPTVAKSLRRAMLRRMRDDVLDLPAWTFETIDVNLNDTQSRLLDKINARTTALDIDLSGMDEEAAERAIQKALSTAQSEIGFEDFSRVRRIIAEASLLPAVEIISEYEEAERPLFVVSAHRKPVEVIMQREGWKAIYGDTSKEERDEIQTQFLAGHLRGVVGTIAACKEGLDLFAADTVLFIDRSWNPSDNEQTASRIRRIGQQAKTCTNVTMLPDHDLVRKMTDLLLWKEQMHAQTLDGAVTHTSRALEEASEAIRALDTYKSRKPVQAATERQEATLDASIIERIPSVPGGLRVAVENESGNDISFWKIDRPEDGRWAGWMFIRQQVGPTFSKAGAIRPNRTLAGVSAPAMRMLKIVASNPEECVARYGKALGVCGICGLELTNEESRARGIGPVCAGKAGW